METDKMNIIDKGENNICINQSNAFSGVNINFNGSNNKIIIGEHCYLRNLNINIFGNNNELIIDRRCSLRGSIDIRHGSKVVIKKCTTFVDARLFALEGTFLTIGEHCMFSSRVYIRTSDEHPIYDLNSKERINHAKDVTVKNNVWIGENVTINKGVIVEEGIIIGSCSIVIKSLLERNSIYAGSPTKLIRENVFWERHFK